MIAGNSQAIGDVTTEEQVCRICGARGPHSLYTAREMMFGLRDLFEYFECQSCACLQIREFPQDISRYYPDNYYAHSVSPNQVLASPVRAVLIKARARYLLSGHGLLGRAASNVMSPEPGIASLRVLRPSRETSILDVGCGNGLRLYVLKEIGFRNLLGVDPFIAGDHIYENGLHIEKKPLADVSGKWDIITFHHSFEHMEDPLETLLYVRRLLKPSGHCVIRIPTASSFAWRHYRTDWAQLDAPRHYFLHSRASMEHLAGSANLRLTQVRYDSTEFQFWVSELYQKDIPLAGHSKLNDKAALRKFRAAAKRLNAANDGDSAAFYLKASE